MSPAWLPVVIEGSVRSTVAGKQTAAGLFTTSAGFFMVTDVKSLLLQVPFVKLYTTV